MLVCVNCKHIPDVTLRLRIGALPFYHRWEDSGIACENPSD